MYTPPIVINASESGAAYTMQYSGEFSNTTGEVLAMKYLQRFTVDPSLNVGEIAINIENQNGSFSTVPLISQGAGLKNLFRDYDDWLKGAVPMHYTYNLNLGQTPVQVSILSSTMLSMYEALQAGVAGDIVLEFTGPIQIQSPQAGMLGNMGFAQGTPTAIENDG